MGDDPATIATEDREQLIGTPRESTLRDWIPALLVASWNVATAPFLTTLVIEPLREGLGVARFAALVGALALALAVSLCVFVRRHVREQRGRRYALMCTGWVLVFAYLALFARGSLGVAVVEALHFVNYGSLAALLLVPLASLRRLAPLGAVCVLSLVALADEGLQWLVPVRTGEFFDLGLNLYAAGCGVLVGWGLFSLAGSRLRLGWRPEAVEPVAPWPPAAFAIRTLAPLIGAVTLVGALFVDQVHLGHRVESEAGAFQSFFTKAELEQRNRTAGERWAEQPPGPMTPFEREDWFRTEAGWHTAARNIAASNEDWRTAFWENRILEGHYSAFLLTPDREGNPRGYPPVQVEAIAASLESGLGRPLEDILADGFVSSADNGRVWLAPSRTVLWSAAAVVAVLALGAWWAASRSSAARREG